MSSDNNPWPASLRNATAPQTTPAGDTKNPCANATVQPAEQLSALSARYEAIEVIHPGDGTAFRAHSPQRQADVILKLFPPPCRDVVSAQIRTSHREIPTEADRYETHPVQPPRADIEQFSPHPSCTASAGIADRNHVCSLERSSPKPNLKNHRQFGTGTPPPSCRRTVECAPHPQNGA